MVKAKRGQAALEFLMTYGWAFLVIMIMIGALAYFGVLSPERFLPDRCKFGTPALCRGEQYVIKAVGDSTVDGDQATIRARLINNFGNNVRLRNISVSTDYAGVCSSWAACLDLDDDGVCTTADEEITSPAGNSDSGDYGEVTWEAGEGHDLIIDCEEGSALTEGDKVKFDIEGEWYPTSSSETYAKSVSGEIYSTVLE